MTERYAGVDGGPAPRTRLVAKRPPGFSLSKIKGRHAVVEWPADVTFAFSILDARTIEELQAEINDRALCTASDIFPDGTVSLDVVAIGQCEDTGEWSASVLAVVHDDVVDDDTEGYTEH